MKTVCRSRNGLIMGVLLASLAVSGAAYAQRGQPPTPPTADELVARMQEDLELTDEQVTQITPIIEEEVAQMEELMSQGGRPDRSKMEALREETKEKLSKYLTDEQLEKWSSRKCGPPQGGDDRRGPPPDDQSA